MIRTLSFSFSVGYAGRYYSVRFTPFDWRFGFAPPVARLALGGDALVLGPLWIIVQGA
jgi:hypothetical protein